MLPLAGVPVGPVGGAVVAATRYGHLGVPAFFVLSGYVIALTAARYPSTPATGGRFLLRRLARIAPPYWVMVGLIAAAVVGGHAAGLFRSKAVSPGQVAAHVVYAQTLLGYPPLDVAYWTLCLEAQFYLAFAAGAVVVHRLAPGLSPRGSPPSSPGRPPSIGTTPSRGRGSPGSGTSSGPGCWPTTRAGVVRRG